MRRIQLTALLALIATITTYAQNSDAEQLKQADTEFCEMAQTHGMGKAFIRYAADEAMILQGGQPTIMGIEQIKTVYSRIDSSRINLKWEPVKADIADSGDLGYTYGTYVLTIKDSVDFISKGYYLTIWKKQQEGNWKYVADVGSPGPQ
ncbi:MAG: hypothetical protein RLO81_01095 [Fulvivirga sp.]|uniref:YybH family protein n=1 Tax=Fulvivirga sp. TaxID=1931237 RepID=UPI0032EF443C